MRICDSDELNNLNNLNFEMSFSRPCSVCCNMLKAIDRKYKKGRKIRVKWSTGNIDNLITSYINIQDLNDATPSSGTRNKYRYKKN
jgi:hypothetical protein